VVEPWPPITPVPPVQVAGSLEVTITFLLYLIFFAWLGYRRGFRSELIVLLVGLFGWLGLQAFGDVVVKIANLGGKFIAFALSGGLGGDSEAGFAALQKAPDWLTPANQDSFLFLVWVILLMLAYIFSSSPQKSRASQNPLAVPSDLLVNTLSGLFAGQLNVGSPPPPDNRLRGWAPILGIANGLLYASIFLPRLIALVAPEVDFALLSEEVNVLGFLGSGLGMLLNLLSQFWELVQPQGALVLLIVLTIFLALVASTLRGGGGRDGNNRGGNNRNNNGGNSGGNRNGNRPNNNRSNARARP